MPALLILLTIRLMRVRCYSELVRLKTFEDRYEYLRLSGTVGRPTFGFDRWINQQFYTSREWRQIRQDIIARDMGNDLAVDGFEIHSRIVIHHMNPMVPADIVGGEDDILEPEFLITTTHATHNAIHYGDAGLLPRPVQERRPGDTKLW
jgi:hypothetical protein